MPTAALQSWDGDIGDSTDVQFARPAWTDLFTLVVISAPFCRLSKTVSRSTPATAIKIIDRCPIPDQICGSNCQIQDQTGGSGRVSLSKTHASAT